MKNFAVLISGDGREALEIIRDFKRRLIKPRLKLILSDNDESPAIAFADLNHIPYELAVRTAFKTKKAFDDHILGVLKTNEVDYLYLAGWTHVPGAGLLQAFPGRVVSTHAALLPAFKGVNPTQQALDYGAKVTGVTAFIPDEKMEVAKIIAQKCVEIQADDTFEELDNRLFKISTLLALDTINQMFV
ncbi:MAG: formyltransferase family protein [Saprospiraceae bacterium]